MRALTADELGLVVGERVVVDSSHGAAAIGGTQPGKGTIANQIYHIAACLVAHLLCNDALLLAYFVNTLASGECGVDWMRKYILNLAHPMIKVHQVLRNGP